MGSTHRAACLLAISTALLAYRDVGVTQFNVYLMCGDEEDTLEAYKREVLPAFRASA